MPRFAGTHFVTLFTAIPTSLQHFATVSEAFAMVWHPLSNWSTSSHFTLTPSIHEFYRGEKHRYGANNKDNKLGTVLSGTLLGVVTIVT